MNRTKTPNQLIDESSPYLLQHAYNPVNWYPWGEDAFHKAKEEEKPIFLSIGYSTCHWCHVMEHESFEDYEVAKLLNENFVSIKVDKEERPDIDSVYMRVCQALTGSGGWPTSIFMTPEQKPFFAGTYFPKETFLTILDQITAKWRASRADITQSGEEIVSYLKNASDGNTPSADYAKEAYLAYSAVYDESYGGFGGAPKFPCPHNLMFLMDYYSFTDERNALEMAKKTLLQMYKGGIFDHIGYGFSRYSTDRQWLAPHFEKMLYDNALLVMAYLRAFEITGDDLFREIAQKAIEYELREMEHEGGGFYAAQDADSEGVEGKYYVFTPKEIDKILGEQDAKAFCDYFDITKQGNFEGKNIPNLIKQKEFSKEYEQHIKAVYEYRKNRTKLHTDKKILTAWNSLMICALADAHRILGVVKYLEVAKGTVEFIENNLVKGKKLMVSWTEGKASVPGFLDDYAFYIMAQLSMYHATYDETYLQRAQELMKETVSEFWDAEEGGFFIYGQSNEQLIMKPKETYDGAIPSGNSAMYYNVSRLYKLTKDEEYHKLLIRQQQFMQSRFEHSLGNSFYLMASLPTKDIVCVAKDLSDVPKPKSNWVVRVYTQPTKEYSMINDKTTYYVCERNACLPPSNEINDDKKGGES